MNCRKCKKKINEQEESLFINKCFKCNKIKDVTNFLIFSEWQLIKNKNDYNYRPNKNLIYDLPSLWKVILFDNGHLSCKNGTLLIRDNFSFNGSTIIGDTENTLKPSCLHDALYTILCEEKLNWITKKRLQLSADKRYGSSMLELGENVFRVFFRTFFLFVFGGFSIKQKKKKQFEKIIKTDILKY